MNADDVDALLAEGVLARVVADTEEARRELDAAKAHLRGAKAAVKVDPTGAFTLAYDAARKAVVAHMRANGFRVGRRFGVHVQTGRYARAALRGPDADRHLTAFENMRIVRNDTEYGAEIVSAADAAEALAHARAIVAAVEAELG